jgi:hypothetical protein
LRRVAAQRANGANGNEGENSPFNNGNTDRATTPTTAAWKATAIAPAGLEGPAFLSLRQGVLLVEEAPDDVRDQSVPGLHKVGVGAVLDPAITVRGWRELVAIVRVGDVVALRVVAARQVLALAV